jgi:hypothetical protein
VLWGFVSSPCPAFFPNNYGTVFRSRLFRLLGAAFREAFGAVNGFAGCRLERNRAGFPATGAFGFINCSLRQYITSIKALAVEKFADFTLVKGLRQT